MASVATLYSTVLESAGEQGASSNEVLSALSFYRAKERAGHLAIRARSQKQQASKSMSLYSLWSYILLRLSLLLRSNLFLNHTFLAITKYNAYLLHLDRFPFLHLTLQPSRHRQPGT